MANGQKSAPNNLPEKPDIPPAAPNAPKNAVATEIERLRQENRELHNRINSLTATPDQSADKTKSPGKGTEPAPQSSEPLASGPVVRNLTSASAEGGGSPGMWSKIKRYSTILGGIGAAGGIVAGGSSVAEWPLLGKIPYLPQAAGWLQSSIGSVAKYLGLNTGTMATNSVMAALPTWVGPAVGGALTIPAALWAIGLAKGYITGKRYGGFLGHVRAGTGVFYQPLFAAYRGTMYAREKAWDWTKTALGAVVGTPAKWAYNHVVKPVIPAVKPTVWGVGGAALGGAMFTGGTSLLVGAGAYAAINYLNNTGWFKGKGGAPGAPAGAAPAQ